MAVALFSFLPTPGLATEQTLIFGMLPSESAITMFKRFAPLRDYLSDRLQHDVVLETAKNYNEFVRRTDARHYDIILTAPHMALRALDSGAYVLGATFTKPLKAFVVVAEDSPARSLADLAGQNIATPPDKAIITMIGKQYLNRESLPDTQFSFTRYRTHNAAWNAALGGETQAAIIANFIYLKVKKQNVPMRLIAESDSFPSMALLVAGDLADELRAQVRITFVSLKDETAGQNILKLISQPGYRESTIDRFESLRPFIYTLDSHE